jgi:transposase
MVVGYVKVRTTQSMISMRVGLCHVAPADDAERMIRSLANLRSIGPDFATLLVREAFVREFRNRRALGGYVGLGGTPFSSGGSEREQGIGKDGNRRLRAAMVELAWMWLRWQRQRLVQLVPRSSRATRKQKSRKS